MGTKYTQTITYWGFDGYDEYGNKTFLAPIQINVRWEKVSHLNKTIKNTIIQGEEIVPKGKIYTNTYIDLESYVYIGITTELNPTILEDAYRVLNTSITPSIKGNKELIEAWF